MKNVTPIKENLQNLNAQEELLRTAIQNYEADNMETAIRQFQYLAEHNCEEAFLYLSLIYRDGDGVEKDELQAARHKKSYIQSIEVKAAQGLPAYRLKLAYMLQFGDGFAIDNERAFQLFLELAKAGGGEAQFHLSRIYAHGWCGQKADAELELHWLDEAVKADWPKALYYSALYLKSESDSTTLNSRVEDLMRRSAELGCWQAKEYLEKQATRS